MDFNSMLYSRHAACNLVDVPPEKIATSAPHLMTELEAIFSGYSYRHSLNFGEPIGEIGALFSEVDPLGIVEKVNSNQLDEYFPEADMVSWLFFSKNLNPRTFWAVWEYQFADLNPYSDENDGNLESLYDKILEIMGRMSN